MYPILHHKTEFFTEQKLSYSQSIKKLWFTRQPFSKNQFCTRHGKRLLRWNFIGNRAHCIADRLTKRIERLFFWSIINANPTRFCIRFRLAMISAYNSSTTFVITFPLNRILADLVNILTEDFLHKRENNAIKLNAWACVRIWTSFVRLQRILANSLFYCSEIFWKDNTWPGHILQINMPACL